MWTGMEMSHPQYDLDHGHLMNLLNRLFDLEPTDWRPMVDGW